MAPEQPTDEPNGGHEGMEIMNRKFSTVLDLARWLAAFLVVVSHVRHLILVDLKQVIHPSLGVKALYFFTGFGHEAVVIFFVLSGYLVGGITLERWRLHGPDFSHYFASRISRIYTVLLPALVVGLVIDWLGLHFVNLSELYTNAGKYHTISLHDFVDSSISIPTFFGNLFMLQGVISPTLGTNGPLWSLSWEWWYYCLFALILGAYLTTSNQSRVLLWLGVAVVTICLPFKIILWSSIWLMGIVVHRWIGIAKFRPNSIAAGILFVAAIVISRLTHNVENTEHHESLLAEYLRDVLVAIPFALLLVSFSKAAPKIPFASIHKRLADSSYSTYLFHFPVMVILVSVGFQFGGISFCNQPKLGSVAYFVCVTIFIYLACMLFSLATEQQTGRTRKWLEQLRAFQPGKGEEQEGRSKS